MNAGIPERIVPCPDGDRQPLRLAAVVVDACQTAAAFERLVPDARHAHRDRHARQPAAAVERPVPDARHAVPKNEFGKPAAPAEGIVPDAGEAREDVVDRDQASAAVEQVIRVYCGGHVELLQVSDRSESLQPRKEPGGIRREAQALCIVARHHQLCALFHGVDPEAGQPVPDQHIIVLRQLHSGGLRLRLIGIEVDIPDGFRIRQLAQGRNAAPDVLAVLHGGPPRIVQVPVLGGPERPVFGELEVQRPRQAAAEGGSQGIPHGLSVQPDDGGDDDRGILREGDDGPRRSPALPHHHGIVGYRIVVEIQGRPIALVVFLDIAHVELRHGQEGAAAVHKGDPQGVHEPDQALKLQAGGIQRHIAAAPLGIGKGRVPVDALGCLRLQKEA